MRKIILSFVWAGLFLYSSAYLSAAVKGQIVLKSAAFENGKEIPAEYTCEGKEISPSLSWTGVPKEAQSIVVMMEDPDAFGGIWTHWILYDLPANITMLPKNLPRIENLANGEKQGKNSWDHIGYNGPCPPKGKHRYQFKIYALDSALPLKQLGNPPTRTEVLEALKFHVLAQGQLTGTYLKRSKN